MTTREHAIVEFPDYQIPVSGNANTKFNKFSVVSIDIGE